MTSVIPSEEVMNIQGLLGLHANDHRRIQCSDRNYRLPFRASRVILYNGSIDWVLQVPSRINVTAGPRHSSEAFNLEKLLSYREKRPRCP